MSKSTRNLFQNWHRAVILLIVAYSVVGLMVDLAAPDILPHSAFTASVGESAKAGAFAIWFYLLWQRRMRRCRCLRSILQNAGICADFTTSVSRFLTTACPLASAIAAIKEGPDQVHSRALPGRHCTRLTT